MRAVVYDRYGPPDVLRVEEVPTPTPGPTQVLIEVVATSVNLSDWECLRGTPMYARIGGLRTPACRTLGSDIAGRVAAVGSGVSRFRVGDEVYGDNLGLKGGFAEYALAPESVLAHKPEALTFAEASTIPQGGRSQRRAPPGCVRANGCSSTVRAAAPGRFAIQLATHAGAHVTGVDNAGKLAFMRSLGADEVVDYRSRDVTDLAPFDHVLDLVAHRSVLTYRRWLVRGGRYRCVGGSVRTLLRVATIGAVVGRLTGRRLGVLVVRPGSAHFEPFAARCAGGDVQIHVDRTFGLDEVPDALAYVGEGRALGKVVVETS